MFSFPNVKSSYFSTYPFLYVNIINYNGLLAIKNNIHRFVLQKLYYNFKLKQYHKNVNVSKNLIEK